MAKNKDKKEKMGQLVYATLKLKDPTMRQAVIDFYLTEYYAKYNQIKGNTSKAINELNGLLAKDKGPDVLLLPLVCSELDLNKDNAPWEKVDKDLYCAVLPEYREAVVQIQEVVPSVDDVFTDADQALRDLQDWMDSYAAAQQPHSNDPKPVSDSQPGVEDQPEPEAQASAVESDNTEDLNNAPMDNADKPKANAATMHVPSPSEVMAKLQSAQTSARNQYSDIVEKYTLLRSQSASAPSKTDFADLQSKNSSLQSKVRNLEATVAQKESIIAQREGEITRQNKEKEDLKRALDREKATTADLTEKNKKLTAELQTTQAQLASAVEANKVYTTRLALATKDFCDLAIIANNMFDSYRQAVNLLISTSDSPLRNDNDDFNYYLSRVEAKFAEQMRSVKFIDEWTREMSMCALTGMLPVGGRVYKLVSQTGGQDGVKTIAKMLYTDVLRTLVGAVVVMCDEVSYLMPRMIEGFRPNDEFKRISQALQDCAKQLGYRIYYIKPFAKLTPGQSGFKNGRFANENLGLEPMQVFEVLKMGVSYGTNEELTEVSAAR